MIQLSYLSAWLAVPAPICANQEMDEGPPDRRGQLLGGRYRIAGPLGAGAMADVYEALDESTQVHVAIKILKEEIRDRSTYQERFEREVLITSKLSHPTCIRVLDFGSSEEDLPYQVMELVPGRPLADVLDEVERMPPERALHILKQLLHALAACGDAGIIHRDLKPENILLYESGGDPDCVKLIDFGIAKLIGDAALGHEKLTSVGLILGTPHYIAPEWVTKNEVDGRADLYSATIMLYEMLTSAPPFLSEDRRELMKMHLRQRPPALNERLPEGHFSDALEAMVRTGLAKEPGDRFHDARDYLRALKALSGESLTNEELKVPSREATKNQPYVAQLAPAARSPGRPSRSMPPGRAAMRAGGTTLRRRFSLPVIAGIVIVLVGLLVVVAKLDGKKGKRRGVPGLVGLLKGDDGAEELDAGTASPDPVDDSVKPVEPKKVEPMRDAQLAVATDAWRQAGMEVADFDKDLEDELANGACRYGKVDGVRVLVCTAEGDPMKAAKATRRPAPDRKSAIKWRGRIPRGELHLRVENVGKSERKTRRKIESVFKALDK